MSADEQTPRDTVLIPDAIVLRAHVHVQCAMQIGEPTDEQPEGQFCGNVIEGEAEIPYEPGIVAEMGIECPACSKRVSAQAGTPLRALIPVALLVGGQVDEMIESEDEQEDTDGDVDGNDDAEELQAAEEDEDRGVVELSPEDQGAVED